MSPKVAGIYKLEVRERIIQVAIQCFSESGFSGTRMEEIAKKLDLAKGTIYLYFASKEELFVAICEYYLEALKSQIGSLFGSNEGIITEAQRFYDHFRKLEGGNHKMMIEMTLESSRNPRLKKALYDHRVKVNRVVAEYLERQMQRGLLQRTVDSNDLALAFISLYDGLTLSMIQGVSEESSRTTWVSMVRAITAGKN